MHSCFIFVTCVIATFSLFQGEAVIKKYQLDVVVKNVSGLCNAKPIVTVNGKFSRPTIYAREEVSYNQCHQPCTIQYVYPLVFTSSFIHLSILKIQMKYESKARGLKT